MRDIFTEIFENQPLDPMQSARQGSRPVLRKRFYSQAHVGELTSQDGSKGFPLLLDGKQVMTPARHALMAPAHPLAEAIAQEWNAQTGSIDPARMPLTRLANVTIDAVANARAAVADEIVQYLGSDLVCYRADAPPGLVARQAEVWDPVLAWARNALGARFMLIEGIVFAPQPEEAIAAARAAIPDHLWRLAAVSSAMALTGSALLALALNAGGFDAEAVWAAAHVDEDWQMSQWGRDDMALERRAARFTEFEAAAAVLKMVG